MACFFREISDIVSADEQTEQFKEPKRLIQNINCSSDLLCYDGEGYLGLQETDP